MKVFVHPRVRFKCLTIIAECEPDQNYGCRDQPSLSVMHLNITTSRDTPQKVQIPASELPTKYTLTTSCNISREYFQLHVK